MTQLKQLMMLLMILLIVGSFGCATTVKPIEIAPLEFQDTPLPDDSLLEDIKEMRELIGSAPKPIVIEHGGKQYIAFTIDQVKQLNAKNEFTRYLEETITLMHERHKLMVMEVNQMKRLAELQNKNVMYIQQLYVDAANRANQIEKQRKMEGLFHKLIIGGQFVALLLLL